MSKNSKQRELPSQYQGAELAVRLMLWVPFAPVEFQNTASFVGLGFKVTILSWQSLSLVITDGIWQFWGEILTSPAVLFLLLQLLLLLNAELVAHPVSCLKVAVIPLSAAYIIVRWGIMWTGIFSVMLVCLFFFLFSHFLQWNMGEKLGEFAHTTSSDDLFMEILRQGTDTWARSMSLPTWWKPRQITMLKNHGLHIVSSVFDFLEAQISGDSFLGVCTNTSDQIIYIPVTQQSWAYCRQGAWTKIGIFCDCFFWMLHARFWLDSRAESRNLFGLYSTGHPLPSLMSGQCGGEKIQIHI